MLRLSCLFLFFVPVFLSCHREDAIRENMIVQSRTVLHNLPSASGIQILGDRIFVISDRTLLLYELNDDFQIMDTFLIAPTEDEYGKVFSKGTKFDFEGIASFRRFDEDNFMVFGSGSKSFARNKLVWVRFRDSIVSEVYELTDFYSSLMQKSGMQKSFFNVEGMCVLDKQLYLFNRGSNTVWRFLLEDFIAFLKSGDVFPDFKKFDLILPLYKNVQAGFSGASQINGEGKILFTASLEDTDNWIDDGEVLGSYVGLIDVENLKDGYEPRTLAVKDSDEMLKLKVESAAIQKKHEDTYQLLLVTDSDGGDSELLEIEVSFRP